jgi:transglutaminase-like putative cysteine protease
MINSNRRTLLRVGLAAAAAQGLPLVARAQGQGWRQFEVTTQVAVPDAKGETQLWLPLPSLYTGFQRNRGDRWTAAGGDARIVTDRRTGARMLHARFADGVSPTLSVTSQVATRSRSLGDTRPASLAAEEAPSAYLAPTALHPVDGIVHQTALAATQGAETDEEKVRRLYDWMTKACYRNPAVAGCGRGLIKTMVESGNLGGKCADLSALFVAMCRSLGVPAREVYGLRLAASASGYRELGANSANLTGAQHCRSEVWLSGYGWVAMDPADVLKVMRQETSEWIRDPNDPRVAPVAKALFGGWEGNWVGWNTANDITLPGSKAGALSFLMYPQGEDARGRFEELAPTAFSYMISAKELAA